MIIDIATKKRDRGMEYEQSSQPEDDASWQVVWRKIRFPSTKKAKARQEYPQRNGKTPRRVNAVKETAVFRIDKEPSIRTVGPVIRKLLMASESHRQTTPWLECTRSGNHRRD